VNLAAQLDEAASGEASGRFVGQFTSVAFQLQEAVTGSAFGGSDFSDAMAGPRVIRTVSDAQEALHKAKKARATAAKERDQATAAASVQDEIVAEYDEAIAMLEKWISVHRGR